MNKKLCFIINNVDLFLDKVLIAFNSTPVLFLCRDKEENIYLVLCIDIDDLEYIVVKQSISIVWKMLTQKISMREVFLNCQSFWKITTGENIPDDTIELLDIKFLDTTVLPLEGAMYETIGEDDVVYIEKLTSDYLNQTKFNKLEVSVPDDFYVDTESLFYPFLERTKHHQSYLHLDSIVQDIPVAFVETLYLHDNERECCFPYSEKMQIKKEIVLIDKKIKEKNSDYSVMSLIAS